MRPPAMGFPLRATMLGVALGAATLAGGVHAAPSAPEPAASRDSTGGVVETPGAHRSLEIRGTVWTAVAEAADTAVAGGVMARALEEAARIQHALSSDPDGEPFRLNLLSGGMWVPCSPDLYAALDSSLALARLTEGAFDPTVEPLNRAWNVRGKGRLPSTFEIDRALALVGWRKISLDPQTRRAFLSFTGMGVDLDRIGAGLAMDRALERLAKADLERALIRAGGQAIALGGGWDVAVSAPAMPAAPAVRISIANAAVSTSAPDSRRRILKGKRYGSVLDPRTGRPVEETGSVTVVAGSATRASALSTALLVMGREAAAVFAGRRPELGVLWLEASGDTLRAWKWNLEGARAEPGARVEWMN